MDWPTRLLPDVTDKNIFCNAPWYELQIYWDGSLGFCCQEDHKLYSDNLSKHYNVSCMTIAEWFDSKPMQAARLSMLGSQPNSICRRCYYEQAHNGTSPRQLLITAINKVPDTVNLNQVGPIKEPTAGCL
jgi:Iron-sulfur cluster-binding domain